MLGTFGYMAPEQVRGLAVDHRADIFAFGAVLYEMLSGERAFKGETAADTMTAVLTKDPPDLDAARLAISPGLDRIVRRCLEKPPELRFQSANDLAFALETLSSVSTTSSAAQPLPAAPTPAAVRSRPLCRGRSRRWRLLRPLRRWLVGRCRDAVEPRWNQFTRITEAAGEETSPTLSPDGGTVAYAVRVNGSWDIYSQRVGGRNATPIVNDPQRDEAGPAFSPDGSLIAFHESDDDGGIFVAGATGESVRRVTDIGFDPAWSPDGKQIAFATEEINDPASRLGDSTLYVVDVAGGPPRKTGRGDAVQPSWSPSGERIVYWSNTGGQRDIYTVAAAGGTPLAGDEGCRDRLVAGLVARRPVHLLLERSRRRDESVAHRRRSIERAGARRRRSRSPPACRRRPACRASRRTAPGWCSGRASPRSTRSRFRSIRSRCARARRSCSTRRTTSASRATCRRTASRSRTSASASARRTSSSVRRAARCGASPTTRRAIGRRCSRPTDARSSSIRTGTAAGPRGPSASTAAACARSRARRRASCTSRSRRKETRLHSPPIRAARCSPPLSGPNQDQPRPCQALVTNGKYFTPSGWSPDGARLAGTLVSEGGRPSASACTTSPRTNDGDLRRWTYAAKWLADSRRVVYFTKNGSELVVLDTVTRKRTVVDVRLPGPSTNEMFAISRDNRTIYYGAARAEADIWIVERK